MFSRRFRKIVFGSLLLVFALTFAVVGIKSFTIGGVKIYFVFGFVPIILLLPAGISYVLRRFSRPEFRRDKSPKDDSGEFRT